MKWILTTGLFALYLVAGCSQAPDEPQVAEESAALIPGCCTADTDCRSKSPRCVEGVCSPLPPDGECWDDTDCDYGETCEGASTCPCGAACLVASHPGTCVPAADPCDGLDYCDCIADAACQPVTEACFCACHEYKCAGDCECICGGGDYLGCQSL
jgi:hypothetical protein